MNGSLIVFARATFSIRVEEIEGGRVRYSIGGTLPGHVDFSAVAGGCNRLDATAAGELVTALQQLVEDVKQLREPGPG